VVNEERPYIKQELAEGV